MTYDDYSDEELAELYQSIQATITDPLSADLAAVEQAKEVGEEMAERGITHKMYDELVE